MPPLALFFVRIVRLNLLLFFLLIGSGKLVKHTLRNHQRERHVGVLRVQLDQINYLRQRLHGRVIIATQKHLAQPY